MKRKILLFLITLIASFSTFVFTASAYNSSNTYQYEINDMRHIIHVSPSSSNLNPAVSSLFLIAIGCIIVFFIIKKMYENAKTDNAAERKLRESELNASQIEFNSYGEPKNFTEQIANEIRKKDGNFSGDKFIWLAENFFITYMDVYGDRNLKLLEELTTEDIFFDNKKSLEEHIERGTAHIRKRIGFHSDYAYRYEFNDKFEYVSIYIKAKMIDYIENLETNDSIHGSKSKDSFCFYSMTLRRKLNDKTIIEEGVTSHNCPNCGANIDGVIIGRCKFCGQTVKTTNSSWRISSVRKTQLGTDLGESGIFRIT